MKSIFFCLFCACQRRAERWEEPRLPGKKAAERGDPQKQGKHRRQSSRPPFPHRSHFLCAVMRFFYLSLPQADIGLRLRKNSVILCDVFNLGIPPPTVSAFKHAAFIREEGRHVLRRSQTGHGEGTLVPDRLPVPRDLRQGIRPVIFLHFHGDAADYRQRAPVKRCKAALAALHKGFDGLLRIVSGLTELAVKRLIRLRRAVLSHDYFGDHVLRRGRCCKRHPSRCWWRDPSGCPSAAVRHGEKTGSR